MTETITLTIQGLIRAKKNSKQVVYTNGRPRIISNKAARQNEEDMVNQIIAQGIRTPNQAERIEKMLEADKKGTHYDIEATIFQPNGIRRDLDNQITSILDALVKSGAILDDCRKFVKKITAIDGGIDKSNPRAEIRITTTSD